MLAIAHRGGAGAWPENTLPAFENSIALGYRYIETDVHVSVDGGVFAFHDDHLGRVSSADGFISDLTAAEIEQVDVSGERVPRLEELLLSWPDVRINIDPKADGVVEPLARIIDACGAVDRVCVGAFSDRRIRYFRDRFGPDLCTSMGPREVARLVAHSRGVPIGSDFAPCAQIPPTYFGRVDLASPRLFEVAHSLDVEVHYWTIDEPTEIARLIDAGAGGILTDRPAVLRDTLIARDEWRATNAYVQADDKGFDEPDGSASTVV